MPLLPLFDGILESSMEITGEHPKHWRKEKVGARKFDIVLLL